MGGCAALVTRLIPASPRGAKHASRPTFLYSQGIEFNPRRAPPPQGDLEDPAAAALAEAF
jgi:hypothetical protein